MYVSGARHWPEVNGQYVIQSCKFNGRVTYKHETRDLYFYYIDQQVNDSSKPKKLQKYDIMENYTK